MDVYVTEMNLGGGLVIYQVWVDGEVYDSMQLRRPPILTRSQMNDIAKGYKEALDGTL